MSETKSVEKKEEPKPEEGFKVPWGPILGAIPGVVGAALGTGWPGIIALLVIGIGSAFGINSLIKGWNRRVDAGDLERAGADSGNTAADLANQARDVRTGLDDLERLHPPQKPMD